MLLPSMERRTWRVGEAPAQLRGRGVPPLGVNAAYSYVDAYMQRVADLNATYVRGRYRPGPAGRRGWSRGVAPWGCDG